MPVTTTVDYSTHSEILNEAGSTGAFLEQMSTSYATVIDRTITTVSRCIDEYCNRRFFTSSGDEVRTFDGPPWRPDFSGSYGPYAYASFGWAGTRRLFLSYDIVSITTLRLANGTYDAANSVYSTIDSRDYFFEPSDRQDGRPAEWLELSDAPIGAYSTAPFLWFSPGYKTVEITGKFGWGSTSSTGAPETIRNVCREETIRWFKGRDAAFSDMTGIESLSGAALWSKFLSARSRMILDFYRKQPIY